MATVPSEKLLTVEELFDLPDDGNLYELVEGRLVRVPPSSFTSSMVAMTLAARITIFVATHQLGACAGEAGGVVTRRGPDTVRAPDFSFVRKDRLPPAGLPDKYAPLAPDLVVEVMSPSDRLSNLFRKIEEYLAAGTRLAWLIIGRERSVFVFHPDQPPVVLSGDASLDGEDVLPGFTLPLSELWAGLADEEA